MLNGGFNHLKISGRYECGYAGNRSYTLEGYDLTEIINNGKPVVVEVGLSINDNEDHLDVIAVANTIKAADSKTICFRVMVTSTAHIDCMIKQYPSGNVSLETLYIDVM